MYESVDGDFYNNYKTLGPIVQWLFCINFYLLLCIIIGSSNAKDNNASR